jgi:hypothetical protein
MINAEAAKKIVLTYLEGDTHSPTFEKYAIQSCELSERNDYWIVRANTAKYVLHGRQEFCRVGANAHLVDVISGEVETVGSGQSIGEYLQDEYDFLEAGGKDYLLEPTFDRTDKAAVIRLRQALDCSLQSALKLASPEHHCWLTGNLRVLQWVQVQLMERGISTEIVLGSSSPSAVKITDSIWHWDLLKPELNRILSNDY